MYEMTMFHCDIADCAGEVYGMTEGVLVFIFALQLRC